MSKYSPEFRLKVLQQLLPPTNLSIEELSEKEGVSRVTLYNWRQQQLLEGIKMIKKESTSPEGWSPDQKLAVVVETYSMNTEEMNEYCRHKGLFSDQIKSWKKACLAGYAWSTKNKQLETDKAKQSKKKIRSLEKELHRKEKALAETAALLTLGKKYDALWEGKEGN